MTPGKAFFDTNVLLYVRSTADLHKQARARALFDEYVDTGRIVLSTQVVQEFFVRALQKLGIPRPEVVDAASELLALPLVINGPAQILSAIYRSDRYQISFWNALILAAAEYAGAEVLFTEDLNDGQQYGSVLVRNPFLGTGAG